MTKYEHVSDLQSILVYAIHNEVLTQMLAKMPSIVSSLWFAQH